MSTTADDKSGRLARSQNTSGDTATALGGHIADYYAAALPAAYHQDADADRFTADTAVLERLAPGDVDASTHSDRDGRWRFTLIAAGTPVALSAVLPMLQSTGADVLDQRPFPVTNRHGLRCWIYDFGLDPALEPRRVDDDHLRTLFTDAFVACWSRHVEADAFNQLVLRAELGWRPISVLRAYAHYLRQLSLPYSPARIAEVLCEHPATATALYDVFAATFDPDSDEPDVRDALAETVQEHITAVESLEEDRILRAMRDTILATQRTNYFRDDTPVAAGQTLSFKLDPSAIALAEMPRPVPRTEVFVYSADVEGVHLRYGPVARGGLRWSDRREDYRTEILGLVKAQAVKNAVIVPVGAKGGFVVKRAPAPTGDSARDRRVALAHGTECYRRFIAALLDVTDNIDATTATVSPPARVRRLDGDDTYLVVAADKGTATFSDLANHVAADYGFWLGDAFASGGTVGYDHKKMGITARGVWESVKRHFRELGRDTQADDFTVVGIGDMSGDVFGNAMLLSPHIHLIAAFDHRHVFVDPRPDPARSFAERRRLFTLTRSAWQDYDPTLISSGGGVWSRTAKQIPVSDAMRSALSIEAETYTLTPAELIAAILRAPVDLLFNGGVGTFVKASTESHTDVGDKANDATRVDADQVRAAVLVEGGNLGITARGRIEFAQRGGRINTDALDNSAGVSCSDHEVNIKILLADLVSSGAITPAERDALLAEMTEEVAAMVLRDNRSQNLLLGLTRPHAPASVGVHARLIRNLQTHAKVDPTLEALPDTVEIQRRIKAGTGLTSPELATLIAHVKLSVKNDLLADSMVGDDALLGQLANYFPIPLRRFASSMANHRLRREIVATVLTNEVVDRGGLSYVYRLTQDTGAGTPDAIRAYMTASAIFDIGTLWTDIDAAGLSPVVCDPLLLAVRRVLDRASRWLLTHRPQPLRVPAEVERFRSRVRETSCAVTTLLQGRQAQELRARVAESVRAGVPEDLAVRVHLLLDEFGLLDIIEVADTSDSSTAEVADLYFALSDRLHVVPMLQSITQLTHDDRWHSLARLSMRDDLYGSMRDLCRNVLASSEPDCPIETRITDWEYTNTSRLQRARALLDSALDSDTADLARLSVAVRQIRSLSPS
ncbi:hypothetical protein BH11ACT6_BH11ACT6_08880 [soil metagenome]